MLILIKFMGREDEEKIAFIDDSIFYYTVICN